MKTIYDECVDDKLEIDHHESDLYIKDCPAARALLEKYKCSFTEFEDLESGTKWLDIPFAYTPFWDKKISSFLI
jgi:hypothetical protein